ncbi:ZN576 protein, partial [Chloropsis hardwickii]|nr:ZN576 protein [Chloropsis hardwickii]
CPMGVPRVPPRCPMGVPVSHGCPQGVPRVSPGCPMGVPRVPADRPGSRRCRRCLITFPDAAFAARHAKRQHPREFAAAALRGALFVCFVCARPFGSSPALLRHQRGHAHRATPTGEKATPAPAAAKATPP